jgi:hypothetical protein
MCEIFNSSFSILNFQQCVGQNRVKDRAGAAATQGAFGPQQQAVSPNRRGQAFDVVGDDILAAM